MPRGVAQQAVFIHDKELFCLLRDHYGHQRMPLINYYFQAVACTHMSSLDIIRRPLRHLYTSCLPLLSCPRRSGAIADMV